MEVLAGQFSYPEGERPRWVASADKGQLGINIHADTITQQGWEDFMRSEDGQSHHSSSHGPTPSPPHNGPYLTHDAINTIVGGSISNIHRPTTSQPFAMPLSAVTSMPNGAFDMMAMGPAFQFGSPTLSAQASPFSDGVNPERSDVKIWGQESLIPSTDMVPNLSIGY